MNQKKLKQIAERWKGKSGGPEAETTVSDSKMDKNYVHVWSCTADVTKIIQRCGSAIKNVRETVMVSILKYTALPFVEHLMLLRCLSEKYCPV